MRGGHADRPRLWIGSRWLWAVRQDRGWPGAWAYVSAVLRCCGRCAGGRRSVPAARPACWASMTGPGARDTVTGRFCAISKPGRSSTCCPIGRRRPLPSGWGRIPVPRWSVATAPARMRKQPGQGRPKRSRWPIDGICRASVFSNLSTGTVPPVAADRRHRKGRTRVLPHRSHSRWWSLDGMARIRQIHICGQLRRPARPRPGRGPGCFATALEQRPSRRPRPSIEADQTPDVRSRRLRSAQAEGPQRGIKPAPMTPTTKARITFTKSAEEPFFS